MAMTPYDQARQQASQLEYELSQQLYFERHSRQKRGPPSPVVSQATTPQEGSFTGSAARATDTAASSDSFVQPVLLNETPVVQTVAAEFGVDVNDQQALERWMATPIKTNRDVLELVRAHHVKVARPEAMMMIAQLEQALKKVGDQVFHTQQELHFMASDNRQQQKNAAGLMLVTTGWPQGMKPDQRVFMLGWFLQNTPEVVQWLVNRGLLDASADHTALPAQFWFNVLQQDPVTVPQGGQGEWFSAMTLLNFKAWELRGAFLRKWGGPNGTPLYSGPTTPISGKHVRIAPCAPQWQRKLESPLRVVLACLNSHPDTSSQRALVLWRTVTLMAPEAGRDFKPDHTAWARVFYEEVSGRFMGRLEITHELHAILQSRPTTPESRLESLWQEKWNEVIWGSQWELDEAECQLQRAARQAASTGTKGQLSGKGRKHWSNAIFHSSWYSPYPFELTMQVVEAVAFVWDEYAEKVGADSQKVGDYTAATFQGKPAPRSSASDMDLDHTEDFDHTAQPKSPAPVLTPQGVKGQGKGAKGA